MRREYSNSHKKTCRNLRRDTNHIHLQNYNSTGAMFKEDGGIRVLSLAQ